MVARGNGRCLSVKLIPSGLHIDESGIVSFVSDYDFKGVERFYTGTLQND